MIIKNNMKKSDSNEVFKLSTNNTPESYSNLIDIIENAKILLYDLDTESIPPLTYFNMFMKVTDQLEKTKDNIINYCNSDLNQNFILIYKTIYTIRINLLCKIYMLSLIGNLICKDHNERIVEMLNEILREIKEIQYPLVSFFSLFYCISCFEESLQKSKIDISREYHLTVIIQMNKLLNHMTQKELYTKVEIENLHCLIIANINKVVSLRETDENIFKSRILNALVSLVFDQEEKTYSDYILDWIISGLSIEFIIDNFTVILQTMLIAIESEPYMSKKINTLLEKIILYHKNSKQVIREKIINRIGNEKYKEIFELITTIIKQAKDTYTIEIKTYLDYICSVIQFTLIVTKPNDPNLYCNSILIMVDAYLKEVLVSENKKGNSFSKRVSLKDSISSSSSIAQKKTLTEEHSKIYEKIYNILLKGKVSLFNIKSIICIAEHFEQTLRGQAIFKLLVYLNCSTDKIDNEEKMKFIVNIMRKVLSAEEKKEDKDKNKDKEHEQTTIGKLMERVVNKDPEQNFKLIMMIKSIFSRKFFQRFSMERSLEVFLDTMLRLAKNLELNYIYYKSDKKENNKADYEIDVSHFDDRSVINFMKTIYMYLRDMIKSDFIDYPNITLQFILKAVEHFDNLKFSRLSFTEVCFDYLKKFLYILNNEILDSNIKVELLSDIVKTITKTTILSREQYIEIVNMIVKLSRSLQKRCDIAKIMLVCCDLYYNSNNMDTDKIIKNLHDAKKDAEFSMVKPENLTLFILLIEKMIFYYEKGEPFIKIDEIKAIDKYINDHLDDVKECNKKVYESILSNQKNYSEKIKVLLSEKTKTPKDNSIQTVTGESNDNKSNCTTITAESEDKKTNFGSKDL